MTDKILALVVSTSAPHTSDLMKQLVHKYLDSRAVRVLEGGIPLTTAVLKEKFDYICYTGNGFVGRIVMRAAAEHLTPVILELGGKSPVVVDASAVSNDAGAASVAKRILFGKYFNSGQTCVAPDYVLVPEGGPRERLVSAMQAALLEFYGKDSEKSQDHGRMINKRHTARVAKLIEEVRSMPGVKITGGRIDVSKRFIEPTLIENPPRESKLMQEEIFGPVLPIVPLAGGGGGAGSAFIRECIAYINAKSKPLALYIYSADDRVTQRVLDSCTSGGVVVNWCGCL